MGNDDCTRRLCRGEGKGVGEVEGQNPERVKGRAGSFGMLAFITLICIYSTGWMFSDDNSVTAVVFVLKVHILKPILAKKNLMDLLQLP